MIRFRLMRLFSITIVAFLLIAVILEIQGLPGQDKPLSFTAFVDSYLDAFAQRHPSIVAGNGLHQYDDRLEDFSAAAVKREISDLKQRRTRLQAIDPAGLSADERVDRRILEGIIDGWLLELETVATWRRNPMIYAAAITDGVHSLMTMESSGSG